MKVLKIISEWKKRGDRARCYERKGVVNTQPKRGFKRVQAVVEEFGIIQTRHIDVKA